MAGSGWGAELGDDLAVARVTGNDLGQLTDLRNWVVVWPPEHKTGNLVYPYGAAKK